MKFRQDAIAVLAAGLILTSGGCGMFGDDSSSDRDRDTLGSGDRIPSAAEVVEDGRGALDYTATDDGTIYVQDATSKKTIATRRVDRGDEVRVEFDEDRIRVDGETIYSGNLERDNPHRIYFAREGRTSSERRRDR